jgi:hypothetical protein
MAMGLNAGAALTAQQKIGHRINLNVKAPSKARAPRLKHFFMYKTLSLEYYTAAVPDYQ